MPNRITLKNDERKHEQFKKFRVEIKNRLKELKAVSKIMLGFGKLEDYMLSAKMFKQNEIDLSPEVYTCTHYPSGYREEGFKVHIKSKIMYCILAEHKWPMEHDWRKCIYTPTSEEKMRQKALSEALRIGEQIQSCGLEAKINGKPLEKAQKKDVESFEYNPIDGVCF